MLGVCNLHIMQAYVRIFYIWHADVASFSLIYLSLIPMLEGQKGAPAAPTNMNLIITVLVDRFFLKASPQKMHALHVKLVLSDNELLWLCEPLKPTLDISSWILRWVLMSTDNRVAHCQEQQLQSQQLRLLLQLRVYFKQGYGIWWQNTVLYQQYIDIIMRDCVTVYNKIYRERFTDPSVREKTETNPDILSSIH